MGTSHNGTDPEASFGQVSIDQFTADRIAIDRIARGASAKRALDLVGVAVMAAILLIPFALIVGVVRVTMGAPVFMIQPRVGRGGRVFGMHKLRTMVVATDTTTTRPEDDRITPVGRWLRRLHVDEVPQIRNIIRGEMSLVGPRPEQPSHAADYIRDIPAFELRTKVLPGLTGWAQLRSGYAADRPETEVKLAHDLYYLENWSLALDLRILAETLPTIVQGKGAR